MQATFKASPRMSALAAAVRLSPFTQVKKAIDDMVAVLKTQQEDEVKKNDWCASSLQENEMEMAKGETKRDDLQAKIGVLDQSVAQLNQGILDAQASVADLHLQQQRASEDRKKENVDFQSTVADQTMTIEVLHKALEKLATFYDKEEFLQKKGSISLIQRGSKQTPPVPQAEYKPNSGSSGVMSMIEKLIHEAKGLVADSKTSEMEAQAAYEALVADTNNNVAAVQK
jgi:chromosome segregation ATPase